MPQPLPMAADGMTAEQLVALVVSGLDSDYLAYFIRKLRRARRPLFDFAMNGRVVRVPRALAVKIVAAELARRDAQ